MDRETVVGGAAAVVAIPYPSVPAGGVDLRVLRAQAVGVVGVGAHHSCQLQLASSPLQLQLNRKGERPLRPRPLLLGAADRN